MIAQGNALGNEYQQLPALKGRMSVQNNAPFQGFLWGVALVSQGVAFTSIQIFENAYEQGVLGIRGRASLARGLSL